MQQLKLAIHQFLNRSAAGRRLITLLFKRRFKNAAGYWETRYQNNGTSGNGSYGELAAYKAKILNDFVQLHAVNSVVEFGCGDGNQLQYFSFPTYHGLDVSPTAVHHCKAMYAADRTKSFAVIEAGKSAGITGAYELSLSLDVIYHLVEDDVFANYMFDLFKASSRYVVIYAWDTAQQRNYHVQHRHFTGWITGHVKDWMLVEKIENPGIEGACDFYVYQKRH